MKLFFGKGRAVEKEIFEYLKLINSGKKIFVNGLLEYLKTNKIKRLLNASENVHSYESKADDTKRNIEHALYGKALLPEFRGDIMRLLERLDRLPNECQTVLDMIGLQNLKIPGILKEELIELIQVNALSVDKVISLTKDLFTDPKEVEKYAKKIDKLESQSDSKERELIRKIFSSKSIDKCDRLLLKELVIEIGSLSDNAEMISDMVTIINIKVKI